MRNRSPLLKLASTKWCWSAPTSAFIFFKWKELWNGTRAKNGATLTWLTLHNGVVINEWRKQVSAKLDGDCWPYDKGMFLNPCLLDCRVLCHFLSNGLVFSISKKSYKLRPINYIHMVRCANIIISNFI